jgi:hypothetical protein
MRNCECYLSPPCEKMKEIILLVGYISRKINNLHAICVSVCAHARIYIKQTTTTTLMTFYSIDLTNRRQMYGTNSLDDLAL